MASKDNMTKEMMAVFDNDTWCFEEIRIDRLKFMKWVDSLSTYEEVRKSYTYCCTKLLKAVRIVRQCHHYYPKTAWVGMKAHCPKQKEVVLLRDCVHDLRELWKNRPKAKRRGNE